MDGTITGLGAAAATPAGGSGSGTVVAVVLAAAVLVVMWRVVLRLALIALVTLALLGSLTITQVLGDDGGAPAGPGAPTSGQGPQGRGSS